MLSFHNSGRGPKPQAFEPPGPRDAPGRCVSAGGGAATAPAHLAPPPRAGRPSTGCDAPAGPAWEPASTRLRGGSPQPRTDGAGGHAGRQGARVCALAEPLAVPLRGRGRGRESKDCGARRREPEVRHFQLRSCPSRVSAFTISGPFKGPLGQTRVKVEVPPKTRLLAAPYSDSCSLQGCLMEAS